MLVALVTVTSCSSDSTESSSQALHGGITQCGSAPCDNDTDDPVANTTVKLCTICNSSNTNCTPDPTCSRRQCSGTLISPTAVLTAAHCVVGDNQNGPADARSWAVIIGNHVFGPGSHPGHTTLGYSAYVTQPVQVFADDGKDIALLLMDPTKAASYELTNAWAFRPTFQPPQPTSTETPSSDCATEGFYTNVGAAGWEGNPFRTNVSNTATDPSAQTQILGCFANDGGRDFTIGGVLINGWAVDPGDSGGPLYVMRSNGHGGQFRDVVGVVHGQNTVYDNAWYADVTNPDRTTPALSAWIDQQMQDKTSILGIPPHSATWLTLHGKSSTSWKGEVDYIGRCLNPDMTGTTPTYDEYHNCLRDGGEDCDCDHWLNAHDNCPFAPNPDQTNTGDQRFGDACRRCPCDPDNDIDNDGACAELCPDQPGPKDNCPFVPNADQTNSNRDFEIANGQPELGDACDPVPSPQPLTQFEHLGSTSGGVCNLTSACVLPPPPPFKVVQCGLGCVPNSDCQTCQCCGNAINDTIVTPTVASHLLHDAFPVVAQQAVSAPVSDTHVRFCQEYASLQLTIKCNGFQSTSSILNDDELAPNNDQPLNSQHPWHVVTAGIDGSSPTLDPDVPSLLYGVSSFTSKWSYQADLNRWVLDPTNPVIPGCTTPPPNPAALPASCLNGTWWVSGKTDTGKRLSPFDTVDGSTSGVHLGTHVQPGSMDGNVADAITPMVPVSQISWCPVPTPAINLDPPPLTGPIGWGPGKLVVLPRATSLQLDVGVPTGDARLLVATTTGNVVAALQGDGSAISAEDIPPANCGGSQVDGVIHNISFGPSTWFSGVEPSTAIFGSPFDALALSVDGTQVLAAARVVGANVQGAKVIVGVAGDPPAPRGGYAAAYSRWAGGVFVAGGQALIDSSTLHDVWLGTPSNEWTNVTPHAWGGSSCTSCGDLRDLGTIDAVTYSFADKKLWIIDELAGSHHASLVRLLRAAPSGAIEQLAMWKKRGVASSYYLSVDHDGGILVSFAKAKGQGFVTARIEVDSHGNASVPAAYIDVSDKLLGTPFVSPVGYGFFIEHGQTPKVLRVRALAPFQQRREVDDSLCE